MEKIKEKERPAYAEWGKFCFVHAPAWVWGIAFFAVRQKFLFHIWWNTGFTKVF